MYLDVLEPRAAAWRMERAHCVLMSGPPQDTHFLFQQNNNSIGPFYTWEHIHSFNKCLLCVYWVPGTFPGTRDPGEQNTGADTSGENEQ